MDCLDAGQFNAVRLDQVGELEQHALADSWRYPAPVVPADEGSPGRADCQVDVGLAEGGDLGDHAARRGSQAVEGGVIVRVDELAVNEGLDADGIGKDGAGGHVMISNKLACGGGCYQ